MPVGPGDTPTTGAHGSGAWGRHHHQQQIEVKTGEEEQVHEAKEPFSLNPITLQHASSANLQQGKLQGRRCETLSSATTSTTETTPGPSSRQGRTRRETPTTKARTSRLTRVPALHTCGVEAGTRVSLVVRALVVGVSRRVLPCREEGPGVVSAVEAVAELRVSQRRPCNFPCCKLAPEVCFNVIGFNEKGYFSS